MMEDLTT
jgi:hypothetical protein